ncbi:recombinase family protein [Rhodococcus koreensis]|uniref:recombinase family protein n=1 Tax=Rhodococcus koreensis TaxID=99653 RepID=UPI00197D86A0|nr:recombinase family protein [Rhodococcus koreensis]QSE87074.1 recombinase family protein [Rhodococcus koreensis]
MDAQERMIGASEQAALDGEWRTRIPMFGYTAHGAAVVESEAAAIRDGAQLLLSGVSTGEISRRWNAAGLITREGNPFTSKKVVAVLRNPTYAALSTYKGQIVGAGQWPAIIDEDTHQAVAGILDGRRTVARDRRWQGSGLYRCGKCGNTVHVTQSRATNFYVCKEASHLWRRQDTLDAYIDTLVIDGLTAAEDPHPTFDTSDDEVDVPAPGAERDRSPSRREALAQVFAAEEVDVHQLKARTAQVRYELARIDAVLNAQTQWDRLAKSIGADDLRARWEKIDADELRTRWENISADQRGTVIAQLMTVTILPSPRGRQGFDPAFVHIEWKP